MTQYDVKLPGTELTFKMPDGSNISEDEGKLALTLGNNLQFETMESALKCVFTKSSLYNESPQDFFVKQEGSFYSGNSTYKLKQNSYKKPYKTPKSAANNNYNSLDKHGKISRCRI